MAFRDHCSSSAYFLCEHCDKHLGEKAYKKHRRRYFHGGEWLKVHDINCADQAISSGSSSPLSDPPSEDDSNVDDMVVEADPECTDSRDSSVVDVDSDSSSLVFSDCETQSDLEETGE